MTRTAAPPRTTAPRVRRFARRPSEDPALLSRGRGRYIKGDPFEYASADEVVDLINALPRDQGGRAGLRPNAQWDRNIRRFWDWHIARANQEASSAFAASRPQLVVAMWPQFRGVDKRRLVELRGSSLDNWWDRLEAAGVLHRSGVRDEHDMWWRTEIWLLDWQRGERWHSYTDLATDERESATSASSPSAAVERQPEQLSLAAAEAAQAAQEAAGGPCAGPARDLPAEPPRSLFGQTFGTPCRDDSGGSANHGCRPRSVTADLLVRENGEQQFDANERPDSPPLHLPSQGEAAQVVATLGGWRTAALGGGSAEAPAAAAAEAHVGRLQAAVLAGAPPLPAIRSAFEVLSGGDPVLTRRRMVQVERLLERGDQLGGPGFDPGHQGATAWWLLAAMADHHLGGESVAIRRASRFGGTKPPQGLAGWVIVLKREVRGRLVAAGRRRRPLWEAGQPGDPRIGEAEA